MKIEFNDDMKEIFDEFMVEAEEILETLDQELVELEENPEDRELLNKIFRGMHTLKGGAGFLGLESVIALAHKIETIFDKLRNDELKLDSNKMDIILEGIDILKNSIYSLKESHEIPDKDEISDILNNLDKIIEGKDNTQETTSEDRTNNKDEKQKYEESPLDIEEQTTQANPNTEKNKNNIEIIFKKDVDPKVQEIIKKYPGKDFKEILDELILLPPDERDMDLIEKIDNLISKGKDVDGLVAEVKETETKPEIKENKTEETNKNTQNEKKEAKSKKPLKSVKKSESETIRVDIDRVEVLMNLVGELVLDRNRIVKLSSRLSSGNREAEATEDLNEAIEGMSRSVSDLQEAVMKLRMQPVKRIFSKFPRIVRDLARKLGKDIKLEMEGEDTEIDRSILNKLEDPLVHLVRNSIDHGIEMPDVRKAEGKEPTGKIKLSALQEGDRIIISIEDDGKGLDPEVIKNKAIQKGLIKPEQAENMDNKDIYDLIFLPGFSTAEKVSNLSGRGVGMDVVASTVNSLRGSIEVDSEKGVGTKITMKLPLTVAIIRTLMVGSNDRVFAIPIFSVSEIIQYDPKNIKDVGHYKSLMLRDEVFLLFDINELFDLESKEESQFIIIINIGEKSIAIAVNELYGEEEIVIKPLGKLLSDVKGIAGATITGDGRVVLILDVNSLINDKKNKLAGVI